MQVETMNLFESVVLMSNLKNVLHDLSKLSTSRLFSDPWVLQSNKNDRSNSF